MPLLVSGVALMAGVLASSGARAECVGEISLSQYFPFANGGGINALTSVISTVNTAFLTNGAAFVSAPSGTDPDTQGGGIWTRGIGGTVDTQASSNFDGQFTLSGTDVSVCGNTEHRQTTVRQDFAGLQVGHDIANLNDSITGGNWHIGVMAGYVGATAKDVSEGGTFSSTFDVPFASIYATYSKGNFFADAQARLDYYQGTLSDPDANGIYDQRLDARGYSLTANVGYRFDLPGKWYVEPALGGVLSRVSVDPFSLSGTWVNNASTGVSMPGTVQVGDIDSALGRASVRVGTSLTSDDGLIVAQPFFTASLYHEFAGDVTTKISTSDVLIGNLDGSGTFSTSRVGTYAQFGLGSAFQWVDTGWLGYARVDYKTGDNVEGYSINAGLRYQLNPGKASLKDGGSLKDSEPIGTIRNWSGLYAGLSAASTWGDMHWAYLESTSTVDPDFAGYVVGGQLGYNYQMGRIVVGVEGDFGQSNAHGVKSCPSEFFFGCEADVGYLGSLTGRLGFTSGRALFYAKGGLAFGEVSTQAHLNTGSTKMFGEEFFANPVTTTTWVNGWTVGGGMEFALTDRWSAKAEYMHYELERFSFAPTDHPDDGAEATTQGDVVRVGVNYRLSD